MTKREAAIVSAYTGYLCGSFADLQAYADEKLQTTTYTHMFGDLAFAQRLKDAARADFCSLVVTDDDSTKTTRSCECGDPWCCYQSRK